jgi:hypothetical protein
MCYCAPAHAGCWAAAHSDAWHNICFNSHFFFQIAQESVQRIITRTDGQQSSAYSATRCGNPDSHGTQHASADNVVE